MAARPRPSPCAPADDAASEPEHGSRVVFGDALLDNVLERRMKTLPRAERGLRPPELVTFRLIMGGIQSIGTSSEHMT